METAAVAPPSGHLATAADDAGVAGGDVARQILVVLLVIGRRHQQADVAAEDLTLRVAEQLLCAAVEGFDMPSRR